MNVRFFVWITLLYLSNGPFTLAAERRGQIPGNPVISNYRAQEYRVNSELRLGVLQATADDDYIWDTQISHYLTSRIQNALFEKNGIAWLGTDDALYRYDTKRETKKQREFHTLIRRVTAKEAGVLSQGDYLASDSRRGRLYTSIQPDQPSRRIPRLPAQHNTLRFEYAAPFFESPQKTMFQHRLDGFDKEWSEWDTATNKEYQHTPRSISIPGTRTQSVR